MNLVCGVDGCPGEWVAVWEDDSGFGVEVFSSAARLFERNWEVCAIDIPIGLSNSGPRQADVLARRALSPHRHSSVFPAPVRPALAAKTWEEACERSFGACGKRISKQAFEIYWRVHEVDQALIARPELQQRVFEIHPEVSFWAMNDRSAMRHRKRSAEGFAERRELLETHFGPGLFEAARAACPRGRLVANDDLLDAFAALWSARRIALGEAASLPDPPERDALGLVSAIWF